MVTRRRGSGSVALSGVIHIIQYFARTFCRNCELLLGAISHVAAKMKPVKLHYIWGHWGTPSFESPLKTSRRGLIAALVQTQNNTSFLLWLGVSFVADKGCIGFKATLWQWQTNMARCCEARTLQMLFISCFGWRLDPAKTLMPLTSITRLLLARQNTLTLFRAHTWLWPLLNKTNDCFISKKLTTAPPPFYFFSTAHSCHNGVRL